MRLLVIFPPHLDFDRMQQRPQRLMEQFARAGHVVLYMNQTDRPFPPYLVESNLWVIPRHQDVYLMLDRYRQDRQVVLWSMWTRNWVWHDRLKPDLTIYDYIDDFPEWEIDLPKMVAVSDGITATADVLYQNMKQRYPKKPLLLLENACEFEHFYRAYQEDLARPADLPAHHPLIGYVGAVAHWLDWPLIAQLSKSHFLAMIGPPFGISTVHSPTLHLLGERPYQNLPFYLRHMDVLIMPFALNQITRATNPIKMWEYLATGKPVVTTAIPETRKAKDYLYIARDTPDFLSQVERAIREHNTVKAKSQIAFASQHSWRVRYTSAYSFIEELLARKY